jgi:hypothetical protein
MKTLRATIAALGLALALTGAVSADKSLRHAHERDH